MRQKRKVVSGAALRASVGSGEVKGRSAPGLAFPTECRRPGPLSPKGAIHSPLPSQGFTLVEMIMVIVITGIIGGIVAVFLKAPVQQYVDVARRADMTDIADTALRRVARDVRLALPNSVRVAGAVSGAGSCNGSEACFLEFLPAPSGGRYRAIADAGTLCAAVAGNADGDALSFTAADTCFEVLGDMPVAAAGNQVVVYNLGITGASAYDGNTLATHNRRVISAVGASSISITSANALPFDSPGHRFHVVSTPASYVCTPLPGGTGGTLARYWGYAIQATQPVDAAAAPLSTASKALLATKVSSCRFTYDPLVSARSGLLTMHLAITEEGETATLYSAAHVSNQP